MSGYNVTCYEVTPSTITGKTYNTELLSGKLVKTIDETSKLTFSLPSTVVSKTELMPFKTLVKVTKGQEELFFGTLIKRSYSILDGTFSYECTGVLGSYQYMPPYRGFAANAELQAIILLTESRFMGTEVGPASCANPWSELYSGKSDLAGFGWLNCTYTGCTMNASFPDIRDNSENAYEFLKAIAEPGNYYLPNGWDWCHWIEEGRVARLVPISGVNDQAIVYDRNLISCDIEINPYVTRARVSGKGLTIEKAGANYPNIFNYKEFHLDDKANGSNYTQTELERYADNYLAEQEVIINAVGFDEGILDNGMPFLDMGKFVRIVYLEDNVPTVIQATISQITYNLTNPSQDRVQLGKRIKPLTER